MNHRSARTPCATLPALALAAAAAFTSARPSAAEAPSGHDSHTERARVVLTQALPPLDGAHLATTIVEVTYGPGEASPPHSHPCAVAGYVVEGALRTQVDDRPEVVLHAGQAFYERPGAAHRVSANASTTATAKFIAVFTCDRAAELSVALPKEH